MTAGFLPWDLVLKSRGKNPVVIPRFLLRKKSNTVVLSFLWCFVIVYPSLVYILWLIHGDPTVRGANPGKGPKNYDI